MLHCHFESALRALECVKPNRLRYLRPVYQSRAYQLTTPARRLSWLWQQVVNLTKDEDIFTEDTFRKITQRLLDDLTASDIEHVDLRIGPSTGRWRWMRTAVDGLDVFKEELTSRADLSMSFLAGVNLTKSEDQLDQIFDTLLDDSSVTDRIAGVDINLLPSDLSKLMRYLPSLKMLQSDGLKVNLHLGELFDNEVSRFILSLIIPNRIGHGVLLLRDAALIEIIRNHNICLDMCPTSNTLLGVIDWNKENPARRALQLGIPVSINTDDPILFNTDMSAEIRRANLTQSQFDAVLADSRKYRYGVT